ncbi:MAG: mucD 3 [Acidobacteria bacterium]|nr:mucD 3 [Acidobacteriota bacterium]
MIRHAHDIRWVLSGLVITALLTAAPQAYAQSAAQRIDPLLQLNGSVEALVARVSRSVVQVVVTSYGPVDKSRTNTDLVLGRQRSMGSGVAIDADGYIITNAHVVSNARRVQVVLPGVGDEGDQRTSGARGRTVDAAVVGVAPEIDLALLKVSGITLPALPLAPYGGVHQGELVFAFGSPEGMRNSVTMGIVSAVARQRDPDNPMVYVQTDAPINHGNSGGPLINVRGELVGINTFILSDSGGSQGMGFAIPAALVRIAYPKLRQFGHLHRGEVGMLLQTVTPLLADGLQLAQDWGAMISDVASGSPAETAGLKVKDIVLQIDETPVDGVPTIALELFTRSAGDTVRLRILRGHDTLTLDVPVAERPHDVDRLTDLVEPETSVVAKLGIFGIALDKDNARLAVSSRAPFGVVVVGHTQDEGDRPDTGLITGDTIHTVNDTVVTSVADLSAALDRMTPRSAVVLHIERNGQFIFLPFELE